MERYTAAVGSPRRVLLTAGSLLAATITLLTLMWLLDGVSVTAAPAAELHVCPGGPPTCDYATVQAAVDAANPGDVIKVATGVYSGVQARAGITQVAYISKTVTVRGGYTSANWGTPDPEGNPATLDAQGLGRVMVISGAITPTVEGLRITGGNATGLSEPYVADAGGGVYVYTAAATISGCVIYGNVASTVGQGEGGGVALMYGAATLQSNTVQENIASTADQGYGGGLYLFFSDALVSGNNIISNTASTTDAGFGGGIAVYFGSPTLQANVVASNTAGTGNYSYGGGLAFAYSSSTIQDNTVVNNVASTGDHGYGGGLELYWGACFLQGNTVQSNIASAGGEGWGGGVALEDSNSALRDNTIADNTASSTSLGYGGGFSHFSGSDTNATFSNNTIIGNTASTSGEGVGGGGFLGDGDITLQGNRILSNTAALNPTATGRGGGLAGEYSDYLSMINNLVAGNQANTEGGGLWLHLPGRLLHNTIADNHGQGIYVSGYSTVAFTNTIIAGHSVGITVSAGSGTIRLEGTLWYSNGTDINGTGIVYTGTVNVYRDPAFVNPGVWDYHLAPGSAAIDAGVDAHVTTDMDGEPRPRDSYDIGADEFGACWARLNNDPAYFFTIQDAVDASTAVTDVVKVAGTCAGVHARAGITQVLYISRTITVRGGFTVTNWITSDPETNPTILDAQGLGRGLLITGDISATIEGLRISGGAAGGLAGSAWGLDAGGGVYARSATVTISGCTVYSSTAETGVGLYIEDADVTLMGNTIVSNTSYDINSFGGGLELRESVAWIVSNTVSHNTSWSGGGIYMWATEATLISNTLSHNTATEAGAGGLGVDEASVVTLTGNTLAYNAAGTEGGGVWASNSPSMTMVSNTFASNTSTLLCGGLWLDDGVFVMSGNTIRSNSASSGGGLCIWDGSAIVANSSLISNTAGYGGGLLIGGGSITLTNNIIAGNSAGFQGSGVWIGSSSTEVRIVHNTIADNSGGDGSGVYVDNWAYSTVASTNTVVTGHIVGISATAGNTVTLQATLWDNGTDWSGAGILSHEGDRWGDAAFIDPTAWEYGLGPGSAAIDAGINAGVTADIVGTPRPRHAGYDIGAYEFDGTLLYLPMMAKGY
jgi:hypothetical protein